MICVKNNTLFASKWRIAGFKLQSLFKSPLAGNYRFSYKPFFNFQTLLWKHFCCWSQNLLLLGFMPMSGKFTSKMLHFTCCFCDLDGGESSCRCWRGKLGFLHSINYSSMEWGSIFIGSFQTPRYVEMFPFFYFCYPFFLQLDSCKNLQCVQFLIFPWSFADFHGLIFFYKWFLVLYYF